jgi:SAM-dependent methyltransferase
VDAEQYRVMYEVEQTHWWYRGIRRNAEALLRRYLAPGRSYDLLDAGCGTGGTTVFLQRFGVVTGLDFSPDALGFAQSRGLKRLVRGSVSQLPFADRRFDALTCFDVLYHRGVPDVVASLTEFRRVLRPGGIMLLREPAFDWLRGSHDVGIHTERRLTVGDLQTAMRRAGFEVLAGTYANMVLFPLAVAKRSAERWLHADFPADLTVPARPVNLALEAILSLESMVARRASLPVGLSAVALGRA